MKRQRSGFGVGKMSDDVIMTSRETWVEKTQNTGLEYLPYKFTGKEIDEETGLYYFGARYLDPKYSRWISVDPALGEYVPGAGKANTKDAGSLPGMGGLFNSVNLSLYHYAGNNPVKYVDPDGRATIGYVEYDIFSNDGTGVYIVRSQNFLEIMVFEKLQSAVYPAFGEAFINLQYKISGEQKIVEEETEQNRYVSVILSLISLAGSVKLSEFFEIAGSVVDFFNWVGLSKDMLNTHSNYLKSFAIEELTCTLFIRELSSDSAEVTEKLYLFAKKKLSSLEYISQLSIDYDFWGNVKNYVFSDPADIEVIRNDINNYKRELMYGINHE